MDSLIEEEQLCNVDDTIFVAVGKNVKESKSTLMWVLRNFPGKKICVLHVHQPAQLVAFMDGKFSPFRLKQQNVKASQDLERQKIHKLLDQYHLILSREGVQADQLWIERDNVEKGIVESIVQHSIRWLVMGAAADKHYSGTLTMLKSRKASYVCQQAPICCHIWFCCKGRLIYTREGRKEDAEREIVPPLQPLDPNIETDNSENLISKSVTHGQRCPGVITVIQEQRSIGQATPDTYDRLEQAKLDAETSRHAAFEESVKRWKAEEDAMEAISKAKSSESLNANEMKKRKEMDEMLEKVKQEVERVKDQNDEYTKELQIIQDKIPVLECQLSDTQCAMRELEEKIISAVDLLISFKQKRDDMKIEHENANQEVMKWRRKSVKEGGERLCTPQLFSLSFLEINESTRNFDPSLKIGEGRYGSVYKGLIRHTWVAIKMLPTHAPQGHMGFQFEVEVLSRVRHPNVVMLIGSCSEYRSLVYEYLPNGSLEDRLTRNNPSLSWQSRVRIATELCSALIFLHSNKPSIIHGNLRPSKILLDANFMCKISDLGISHLIPTRFYNKHNPDGSVYIDPEALETGELTVESDVYSFGIIILQLLTGRPCFGVLKDVICALEKDCFDSVLDFSAGNWPIEEAQRLAQVALRCCEKKRLNRPHLEIVWSVLEPLTNSFASNSCLASKEQRRIPSHFVCPILQEIMKEPHIAADGFTYEGEAIKGWLNSGHNTSPMTNLKLEDCNLLPNYALQYAIQEWLQRA